MVLGMVNWAETSDAIYLEEQTLPPTGSVFFRSDSSPVID